MESMRDILTKKSISCTKKMGDGIGETAIPTDDGSYDWYMEYGPSPKNASEMRKRTENDRKKNQLYKRQKARLREERELENKESAQVIHLPFWPDDARGVPNSVLRGSLFAAIQERHAKHVSREVLHDSKSLKIVYTGVRLTQTDLDVWELALHISRKQKLGNRIYFTEHSFLKQLGRKSNSKQEYEWLKKTIARLKATSVEITHDGKTYGGSLVDGFFREEESGRYCIEINPRIARLFDSGYTLIDWNERQLLGKRRPLAQWLHGYISSHKVWVPHKVETVKKYSGSTTKELKKFKQSLVTALELLKSKNLIKGFRVDSDNFVHIALS